MVKNAGGNKQKKQGRKHIQAGGQGGPLRVAKEEDEIYAIVNKIYGGTANVKCIDGKSRIMHIRNKFKGRGKRDNILASGTWVLVGRRSWEQQHEDKLEKCDLLEVYNTNDISSLKQKESDKPWSIFNGIGKITNEQDDYDEASINFIDETEEKYHVAIEELSDMDSDEIDIDDI